MEFARTKEKAQDLIHEQLKQEDVLERNEIEANRLVASIMFAGSLIILLTWVLCRAGVFQLNSDEITPLTIQAVLELMLPALLCHWTKGRPKWLKYLLVIEFLIVLARLDCALSYNVVLVMALPVVLSSRYFSQKLTTVIAVLTGIVFGLSAFANAHWNMGLLDLNFYEPPAGTTLHIGEGKLKGAVLAAGLDGAERTREMLLLAYLPKLLIFLIIAAVCIKIAGKGRKMVLRQEQITLKSARIESELTLANNIQAHMLPTIFPPFPDQNEVDLYATMHPAKEVGGDFYDFFQIDETHIAFAIADVSGKGVPAALVMVITKTLIKNEVSMGLSPAEAFTKVNHMLCEGNDNNMFVTAWLGVLNTESGVLTYANAGHNPPLIRQANGEFVFLKSRPGLVLAGMDGLHYRQYELQMQPGDRIFLYTDGITEATNPAKELYGNDRLQAYLNAHGQEPLKEVLSGLTADINAFAGTEEQFDDMTMLILDYLASKPGEQLSERRFAARDENLSAVIGFVEQELEQAECSPKTIMQISLCVEELFTNVVHYAYPERPGEVAFALHIQDGELYLRMSDSGIPFDPLKQEDPDISLSAEERQIGGLGIFLVKKTMDEVRYEYKDSQNILTMRKKVLA